MEMLEWNTLQEAAEYLIKKTGQPWTERRVLDAALKVYQSRPNGHSKPTVIRAAPPRKTRFALYRFATPSEATGPFIRIHNMPWRTIPLYPCHVFELLTCGETEVGIVGSSDDGSCLKENEYVWIEPLEHPLLINLAMAGITGQALEAIPSAINKMEIRRGIKPPENKTLPITTQDDKSTKEKFAHLFDPVPVESLEKMFPSNGKWKLWAEKAKATGLSCAKITRAKFNPYLAGVWFIRRGIEGWDEDRLNRTLANNLPERSRDYKHLLTGKYD